MERTLYIEPFSGVAGDMFLSALCALTEAYPLIESLPEKLGLPDGKIEFQELNKNGIVCTHIKIVDTGANHHSHSHQDHAHHHGNHRHLSDIVSLIENGRISENAKRIAKEIFTIIGESESRIHGIPIETIHFHEVSGVDSILDIVGCAVLIDQLEITRSYCDPICVGSGSVQTQHGLLPVPAPATADILRGMPTFKGDETGERCTPTGAAILKFLAPRFESCPLPATRIAYGPGQKTFRAANVLRLSLCESDAAEPGNDRIWVIETNIDDMSPEELGCDFQDALLAAGAVDVVLTPAQMKKGRPAVSLSALAPEPVRERVIDFILENTSSIGLRYYSARRRVLQRRKIEIDTELGTLLAKETIRPSGRKTVKAEYESLKALAQKHSLSLAETRRLLDERSS
ncbi:nickel pincer cofactor biosynthesis protein LarC [Pelagicoccus sp. SDUM812003]|uniref:nickel pincer cofactor biosynthesis protein LarC n=1 Tax=Pelagicoccus sp. SDUM812003 TaxID=3041267 RepID=UPI00280F689B|nr:nickel pincer cofactor biosynthesis protein LarC [Pelagicoccus sp. SDUM812003]MDQ8202684.1 nickel pincer cofactor biosynthesis protein LarC [Pelagicoccus sp. SDUM812003]